jgi:hypothetical protein
VVTLLREEVERSGEPVRVVGVMDVDQLGSLVLEGRQFIAVSADSAPSGLGLVPIDLPEPDLLMPSCNSAVSLIIAHLGKEAFLDFFDKQKTMLLKEILRRRGVACFVDSVIRTIYLAEVENDDQGCLIFLRGVRDRRVEPFEVPKGRRDDSDSAAAQRFFQQILSRHRHPHLFAKTALSYFVVHGLGYSTAEAARVLNISRTTLQEHLRLAPGYGVHQYFGALSESKLI